MGVDDDPIQDQPGETPPERKASASASGSDADALVVEAVYDELRRLAASWFARRVPGETLQPTALVHEAWLRLRDRPECNDREHLLAIAARAMRHVLIDALRRRGAAKRGGDRDRVDLAEAWIEGNDGRAVEPVDLLALEEALEGLNVIDERAARVVELRCFGGLTIARTADVLGVGTTTVEDDWAFARAWLRDRLGGDAA